MLPSNQAARSQTGHNNGQTGALIFDRNKRKIDLQIVPLVVYLRFFDYAYDYTWCFVGFEFKSYSRTKLQPCSLRFTTFLWFRRSDSLHFNECEIGAEWRLDGT